jgi:hypothetical protein
VNGHGPYRFLLDTGTQLNHLEPSLAKSIGLRADLKVDVISAASVVQAPAAGNVEITLDTATAGGQTVVLTRLESLETLGSGIRGVLGQAFLSQFDYMLDLRNKRLEFGHQDPEGVRTSIRRIHNRPLLETSLGPLILDSGAASVILFGVPSAETSNYVLTLAGTSAARTIPRKPLTIEGRDIAYRELVGVPGKNEAGAAGLLPLSVFKSIFICNSEDYAVFK